MSNFIKTRLSSFLCYKMLEDFDYLVIKDRFSDLEVKIEKEGKKSLYHAIKEAVTFLLKNDSHFVVSSNGHQFFVDTTKNKLCPSENSSIERNKAYCYDLYDEWILAQLEIFSQIDHSAILCETMQFMRETDEGMSWYDCWNEGNFEAIFEEWPETPISLVFGCDSLVFCDI
ncbi:hypothetical protein [Aeromonas caviae]|uniref:hypothetical protein n=1 Tax=Aeromonas caviae TaxID=648 RepID=UPI00385CFA74